MELPQAILAFADRSETTVTLAAATVLSTLLGIDKILLQNEPIKARIKFPKPSVLLLSQTQINKLAGLRLFGFDGAVLVLSSESFAALKAKYRILCWGQGSHDGCQSPWTLAALIEQVTELVLMEPENLKMLQKELKAPDRWYRRRAIPCLKRLEKHQGEISSYSDRLARQKAIASLATLIEELRDRTPVACHTVVEIAGDRAQIQQHFQIILEQMHQSHTDDAAQIARLHQVFAKWRGLALNIGEGLGVNSFEF